MKDLEIVPGIHQLKIPIPDNPLGDTNTYLIEGDKGWLLVDTGWNVPEALAAYERQLEEIGLSFEDISLIVVTHIHPDHYGLAGRLKELSGAKLALHQVEDNFIESRYVNYESLLEEMGRWLYLNGVPEEELARLKEASLPVRGLVSPTRAEVRLSGGEKLSASLFHFQVLWTPGHSPGHICLYERERKILLSGDHILPVITPNVSLHVQSGGNPLRDYIRSLKEVQQLEVDLVLPAHEQVFQRLGQRIEEILRHHEEREAAIMEAIEGEETAYHVSSQIPWDIEGIVWEDFSPLDKRLAVAETLAHLELLREEGKVEKAVRQDRAFYIARNP